MAAVSAAPLPSSSTAAEQETATRQEEEASKKKRNDGVEETIPLPPSASTLPPPCSSSSLAPNLRVRVRGVPATVRYVGPVANKDPADAWIGLEWDDDGSEEGRGKHDGSVCGVRYFQTRQRRRSGGASSSSPSPLPANSTGSLVRAAALDAPGVLVVGCSVEEALVRRYRSCCSNGENENRDGDADAAPSSSSSPAAALPPSSAAAASFVAGHEEVAARLARIHELEVASVAGSPAAFCLKDAGGGGEGSEAAERGGKGPLDAPLGELAPRLRALDAAGCLFSEWREIEGILRELPGLERLDLTRCGGLAAAEVMDEVEDDKKASPLSLSLPPLPRPSVPRSAPPLLHGLRELVLADTGTEWAAVLAALAASGVTGLRALSLRRCGLRGLGGARGGVGGGGGGGASPAGSRPRAELLLARVASRLEELDLSENDLSCWRGGGRDREEGEGGEGGSGSGSGIADELEALPRLSVLDLSRNPRLACLPRPSAASHSRSSSSSPASSSSPSPSPSPSSFAALRELRLAECGFSSWAELECLFVAKGEERGGEGGGDEGSRGVRDGEGSAAATKQVLFPSLSSLRLSGNPLPVPHPTTGCARADVVARLRAAVSTLNGARVGLRERADARRALEAARRIGGAAGNGPSSLGGGGSSSPPFPPSSTGIMAPMAASMLELRIVLSEEAEPPFSTAATTTAEAAAAERGAGEKTTTAKAKAPVRLPGSTTVTRLRQLAARLTGVPAREQVLRVEMRGGGEERGEGGCDAAARAAAADGDGDDDKNGDDSIVLLELTPADDSRDLRFLGVPSGSVVRVSRR